MNWNNFHLITIINNIAKYLILLVVPIVRALLFTNTDFLTWLEWAWVDVFIILLMLSFGIIRYKVSKYTLTKKGIFFIYGLFWQKRIYVPYKKISILSIEHNFFYKPIKAVSVKIDTDAGSKKYSEVSMIVSKENGDIIYDYINRHIKSDIKLNKVYKSTKWEIFILSLVCSNSLTGILFASAAISFLGEIIGRDISRDLLDNATRLEEILAFKLPPYTAVFAYILLGGWFMSFLMQCFRNYGFTASRKGKRLTVKTGVFTNRAYIINTDSINNIRLVQSLLTKIFNLYICFISVNGYGKQRNELSVIMPAAKKNEIVNQINQMFPDYKIKKRTLKPRLDYIVRFILIPIYLILGEILIYILCIYFINEFTTTITIIGLIVFIPTLYYSAIKLFAFFYTGIAEVDNVYSLYFTHGFRIYTIIIKKEKVVKLEVIQSMLQKIGKGCDIRIYPFSEAKKSFYIPNLVKEEVLNFFNIK